jgi:hypothetical protein
VNQMEEFLTEHERAKTQRDDSAVLDWLNHGVAPEHRLLKFDAWARRTLEAKLDWEWAGAAKQKRIEQCRLHLEHIVLDLWKRGWMLDGKRLASHIETALDAIAAYQRKGAVQNFWAYYQACIDRYVGSNAEEIRDEAMRVGSHISQAFAAMGIRKNNAPTIPELVAQRTKELAEAKSLRSRLQTARRTQKSDTQSTFL